MSPNLLAEIAHRILIAAVDLGWTPPAWRSGPESEAFSEAETAQSRIGQAIETQRTLSTPTR